MSGGFDIQSFFKGVPPPSQQAQPPPQMFGGPNQGPPGPHQGHLQGPPGPLPPGFRGPPPPGYMHPQQFQGPPAPFPYHLLGQQQFQGGNIPPHAQLHPPPPGPPNSAGADLMALLRGPPPPPAGPQSNPDSGAQEKTPPFANGVAANSAAPQQIAAHSVDNEAPTAPPLAFSSGSPPPAAAKPSYFNRKATKGSGRVLSGSHVVYDISERRDGEAQPQLEVHTISKVPLEYRLELGREIAVNRNYICYGMKTGSVRILSQVEDAKVLLKEHGQRLTDLAIFAEDVNLLASASSDGRMFLHEVVGHGKKDTRAQSIIGLQFPPEKGPLHVAWNPRQQEHLAIVQGNSFYLAEVSRLQQQLGSPQEGESAPVLTIDPAGPPEGLRLVGTHADLILDVSFSPAGDRIASASKDGLVKVWGGEGEKCLTELTPHSGAAVSSVRFVAAPGRADDVVMITGGPANQELKLWSGNGGEGVALSEGGWQCVQTVELTSSSADEAFFNHLHVDHRSCLVFLANTLRNSLYVLSLRHGADRSEPPAFEYLAEFSFTAPILSFTTLNEGVVDDKETVEIYTVQPEKIQRYALDAALCRPPPLEETPMAQAPVAAVGPLSPLILSQLAESAPSTHKPLAPEIPSAPSAEPHSPEVKPDNEPSAPNAPEGLDVSAQKQPGVSPDLTREFSREHGQVNLGVGSRGLVQNMNELKRQASRSRTDSPGRQQGPEVNAVEKKAEEELEQKRPEQGVESAPEVSPLTEASRGLHQEEAGEKLGTAEVSQPVGTPTQTKPSQPSAGLLTPAMLMGGPKREDSKPAAPPPVERSSSVETARTRSGGPKQHVGSPPKAKGGNNVKWAPKAEVVSSAPPVEGLTFDDVMKGVAAKKEESKGGKKEATSKGFAAPPATAAVAALAVPPLERKETPVPDQGGPSDLERVEPEKKRKGKEKDRGLAQAEADAAARAEKLEDVTGALQTGPPKEPEAPAGGEGLVDPAALTSGGFILAGPAKGRKKNKGGNQATPNPTPNPAPTSILTQSQNAAPTPPPIPPAETTPGPSAPGPAAASSESTETLAQMLVTHGQTLKQVSGGVAAAVAKEGKRIETALGLRLEKVIRANAEAQLARAEEERVRRERAEKLRMDTALQAITGALSRDMPALVEKSVKKEITAAAPSLSKLLGPTIEKSVQEALIKGDGNKDLSQLEKTVGAKLEAALSRQVQTQFQTTLKAALQETLRTSFQSLLIPSFEAATRAMFEQIEGAVRGGMADQSRVAQQAGAAALGEIAGTLQDTVASASALVVTLQGEIAEGQRKLVALAEASGKQQRSNSMSKQGAAGLPDGAISLQHVEESLDPTKELSRLMGGGLFEEAFQRALNAGDVSMVTWLCNQVSPSALLGTSPLPLSQGVLLSLVSQLGSDLANDTTRKLDWISQAVLAINPDDPLIAPHMRPYLEQLYQSLHAQLQTGPAGGEVSRTLRTIIHVVNSLLTSCK